MPDSLVALAIVVFFFLPGFIAAQTFIRNAPYAAPGDLRFILQVAFWGALVHALAFPLSAPLIQAWIADPYLTNASLQFLAWLLGVIIAGPFLLGLIVGTVVRDPRVQQLLRGFGMSIAENAPTAWDVTFGPGNPGYWVKAHLRENKEIVAGKLGTSSAAGISPDPHDLYLEEQWELDKDGWFLRAIPSSHGVWITEGQIDYVELFRRPGRQEADRA